MALNIKDAATERSVRTLAAETGEAITTTIRRVVEDRLERLRRQRGGRYFPPRRHPVRGTGLRSPA